VPRFGILQRYVMGEVFRAFALALLTITCVFVLLTVMTKASQIGLGPGEIARLIPYMIPSSLPYTVPVSLLFAATVVYGRLASDNEVIAVKTAGLGAMVLVWPSIALALFLSITLSYLSATKIPEATCAGKQVIFQNVEDFLYKKLKMHREFDVKNWPFQITVKDVEGRVMIGPTFKKRSDKPLEPLGTLRPLDAEEPTNYDMIIRASRAWLQFDFEHSKVRIFFQDADIRQAGPAPSESRIRETFFDFDVPNKGQFNTEKMTEELTVAEMRAREDDYREKIALERKHQAVAAAWYIGSGRLNLVEWRLIQAAFKDYDFWGAEINKYETEIQTRMAMAWGSLFFVVLGAPVGMIFARRDFLSAFISCFLPIILIYYPLILFGQNLGKEGILPPVMVWSGNLVLWLIAMVWAIPPIRKH